MDQPQLPILKEIRPHGTESFPCAIYRTQFTGKGTLVKHHWHDEAEILYFSGGKFRLEINMESFFIDSECLYFINPGELHSIITETSGRHLEDAVVFSPGILNFDSCDEAQIRLVRPIQNGRLLFPRCILSGHPAFIPIQNAFMDIMHSFGIAPSDGLIMDGGSVFTGSNMEDFAMCNYPAANGIANPTIHNNTVTNSLENPTARSNASADGLDNLAVHSNASADSLDNPAVYSNAFADSLDNPAVHSNASADGPDTPAMRNSAVTSTTGNFAMHNGTIPDDLASQLYIKSSLLRILATLSGQGLFTPTEKNTDKRVEGIKTTLTYIREHYKEKIYISDLAGQVNLNEQYFCRFFKKAIGRSPMEYVNEYRIRQACRLLEETELSVMETSLECGCNNLGNFLREFRKYTGTTPLQYRKKTQKS